IIEEFIARVNCYFNERASHLMQTPGMLYKSVTFYDNVFNTNHENKERNPRTALKSSPEHCDEIEISNALLPNIYVCICLERERDKTGSTKEEESHKKGNLQSEEEENKSGKWKNRSNSYI
ncbi:unnamed protein product, partial [Brassica napus]